MDAITLANYFHPTATNGVINPIARLERIRQAEARLVAWLTVTTDDTTALLHGMSLLRYLQADRDRFSDYCN